MFLGIVLVLVGSIWLLNEFGIIYWNNWGKLWPVIVIALGAKMIFNSKKTDSTD
ncbi:MAG: hypothetical protein KAR42_09020 [candidate division Zixibacteria bacterium]|nr:hypothetical protein [candidate division Zixibacteria bacterium]